VEAFAEVLKDYFMENWVHVFNTIAIVWVLGDGESVFMLIGVYYLATVLVSIIIATENMGR
jgi:hypothetical protein